MTTPGLIVASIQNDNDDLHHHNDDCMCQPRTYNKDDAAQIRGCVNDYSPNFVLSIWVRTFTIYKFVELVVVVGWLQPFVVD